MVGFNAMVVQTTWVFDFASILLPSWLLLWASADFRKQWINDFVPKVLKKIFARNSTSTNVINVQPFNLNLQISSTLQRRNAEYER